MSRQGKRKSDAAPALPSTAKRKRVNISAALEAMPASNGNSAAAASSSRDGPVDLSDVKAWIAEYERNPQPLTPALQKAILDLKHLLRANQQRLEMGGQDWISLLHRYRDAHQDRGTSVDFSEPVPVNGGWSCQCIFGPDRTSDLMTFPLAATPGGPASFGRKKDAKQYAAKCCVQWLMEGGYMPTDGQSVAFPKGKARPQPAPSLNGKSTNNPSPSSSPSSSSSPPKNNSNGSSNGDPLDLYSDSAAAPTERVEALCRRLGLAVPRYEAWESESDRAFFDARADFGADAVRVPDGVGAVPGVYGSARAARERVAEQVLLWLVREERKRREGLTELCGGGVGAEEEEEEEGREGVKV